MTDRDQMDPDDLAEHAEQKRREIGRTIDSLENKFSPGQVFEEVVSTLRSQGGGFGRNLADSVRENPLPLIVTGVGLAWLMASSSDSGRDRSARRYRDDRYEDDDDLFDVDLMGSDADDDYDDDDRYADRESRRRRAASGAMRNRDHARLQQDDVDSARSEPQVASMSRRIEGERTVEVRHTSGDVSAGDRSRDSDDDSGLFSSSGNDDSSGDDDGFLSSSDDGENGESLARKRQRAQRRMREGGARMRRKTRRGAERTVEQAQAYFQEQPLVAGALGIALGAALGAMLPPTRMEDRHLGERSDRMTNRIQNEAESAVQEGRQKVEEKAEEARREAEQKAENARRREAGGEQETKSESSTRETEPV